MPILSKATRFRIPSDYTVSTIIFHVDYFIHAKMCIKRFLNGAAAQIIFLSFAFEMVYCANLRQSRLSVNTY